MVGDGDGRGCWPRDGDGGGGGRGCWPGRRCGGVLLPHETWESIAREEPIWQPNQYADVIGSNCVNTILVALKCGIVKKPQCVSLNEESHIESTQQK